MYHFYDDAAIDDFILKDFGEDVFKQYNKLAIGAAKADFFRYAILFKKGGIYLDVDSKINGSLDSWIKPEDEAIITNEDNPGLYVQWALIYSKGHPFLQKTIEAIIDNIKSNKYPNQVLEMTGPNLYSKVLKDCFKTHPKSLYRMYGTDYNGKILFKYWLSGFSFNKKEHWRVSEKKTGVLRS
ncbi:hypothetical protein MNBD_BACTEROID06-185 [hydrothermal vent metagenome]|uniref:Mannosyltransferase involved in polysaccharide biosynthesis n=1 Tax=hydrothermal vent metagenome TaxID=652676 RepID=A0A3B0U6Y5_9ZZZZ